MDVFLILRYAKPTMMESVMQGMLGMLSMPEVGLSAVFLISFISATLLPMGSEPAVFAVMKANAALFWPVIWVATAGNTLGGVVNYWLGYGAQAALMQGKAYESRWLSWLERFGAKTMLLAWLPGIGDPICSLAGWLRLPFWPSVFYMGLGKFLRYAMLVWLVLHLSDVSNVVGL